MRTARITLMVAVLMLLACLSVNAQICGDINGDTFIDLSDFVMIMEHIGTDFSNITDTSIADVDGRIGITISDGSTLMRNVFFLEPFSCPTTGSYSFAPSLADTIFIPVVTNVPDVITDVNLPVLFSLDTSTFAVYLPIIPDPPGLPNDHFDRNGNIITRSSGVSNAVRSIGGWNVADTFVFMLQDFSGVGVTYADTLYEIPYTRTEPGLADITPAWADRSPLLRIAVEKNGDLYTPVIVTYNYQFTPDTLLVTPESLSFSVTAGQMAHDTQTVNITASIRPAQFAVTTSDPWILLPNLPLIEPTTPFAMQVTIDASTLPVGDYSGYVDITPLDTSVVVPVGRIPVDVSALAPGTFPFGDINCDGVVDIADLTRLIGFLFLNQTPLTPCQ